MLDVQGDDLAFSWVAAWPAAQPVGRRLRHLCVVTHDNNQMGGQNLTLAADQDGGDLNVRVVPPSRQALLRFRGHWPSRLMHSLTLQTLAASRGVILKRPRGASEFTAGHRDGRVGIHVPAHATWTLSERRAA